MRSGSGINPAAKGYESGGDDLDHFEPPEAYLALSAMVFVPFELFIEPV